MTDFVGIRINEQRLILTSALPVKGVTIYKLRVSDLTEFNLMLVNILSYRQTRQDLRSFGRIGMSMRWICLGTEETLNSKSVEF